MMNMPGNKHIPLRRCVGCQEMKPKQELIRVIRTPEGILEADATGRKNGRGAYLCRNTECFDKAVKNKGLQRSLKCVPDEELLNKLRQAVEDNKW